MKLTEQQFIDSLSAEQKEFFNAKLIEIRTHFQTTYADSVTSVAAAKDQLLAATAEELEREKKARAETHRLAESRKEENDQLTARVSSVLVERDSLKAQAESVPELIEQISTLTSEVARLTALIPPPVENYMITPGVFVERLEAASPGVIDRLWESDAKEAGRLAVTLFTWTNLIDCRPGGRLEGYLNMIVKLGLMESESIKKVWI